MRVASQQVADLTVMQPVAGHKRSDQSQNRIVLYLPCCVVSLHAGWQHACQLHGLPVCLSCSRSPRRRKMNLLEGKARSASTASHTRGWLLPPYQGMDGSEHQTPSNVWSLFSGTCTWPCPCRRLSRLPWAVLMEVGLGGVTGFGPASSKPYLDTAFWGGSWMLVPGHIEHLSHGPVVW